MLAAFCLCNNYPYPLEGNSEEYDLSIATCYLCSNYKILEVLALSLQKRILLLFIFLSLACGKSQLLKKNSAASTVIELIKSAWQRFVKALRIKGESLFTS